VDRGADAEAVKKAFAVAVSGGNSQRALEARTTLLRPLDRGLVDAFLYDPAAVANLSPSWGSDGSALQLAARLRTSESWTEQMRSRFPDVPTMHCLAVLWFWWAVHESDRFLAMAEALDRGGSPAGVKTTKKTLLAAVAQVAGKDCEAAGDDCSDSRCPWLRDCKAATPPLADLWTRTVAYWSALIATKSFWTDLLRFSGEDAKSATERVENDLRQRLATLKSRFGQAHASGLEGIVNRLEVSLEAELQTARSIARSASSILAQGSSGVGCGKLLLEELGLLETVQSQLAAQLTTTDPSSERLREIQSGLSPLGPIAALVERQRWDEALAQLKHLSAADRETSEAKRLQARAWMGKATQLATAGNMSGAMKAWKAAIEVAPADLKTEAAQVLVDACVSKASAMESQHPDEAIDLLEEAMKIVPGNRNLCLRLGALLMHRGIKVFNEVQTELNGRAGLPNQSDVAKLEVALKDLERAASLGDPQAAQQLEAARGILSTIRTVATLGFPGFGTDLPMPGRPRAPAPTPARPTTPPWAQGSDSWGQLKVSAPKRSTRSEFRKGAALGACGCMIVMLLGPILLIVGFASDQLWARIVGGVIIALSVVFLWLARKAASAGSF
jgi:tetratricopeptide (TPR) repeat protein